MKNGVFRTLAPDAGAGTAGSLVLPVAESFSALKVASTVGPTPMRCHLYLTIVTPGGAIFLGRSWPQNPKLNNKIKEVNIVMLKLLRRCASSRRAEFSRRSFALRPIETSRASRVRHRYPA